VPIGLALRMNFENRQAVFALSCEMYGTKGTYVVSYGIVDPFDAVMVRRLTDGRQRRA